MIRIRKAAERGHFDHGWLDTRHTFSFGRYHDPRHVGFRGLAGPERGLGEAGRGLWRPPPSGHGDRDLRARRGARAPRQFGRRRDDSSRRIAADDGRHGHRAQRGQSVDGRERPPVSDLAAAGRVGLAPSYEQRAFPESERRNRLRLVASPDGRDGSLTIRQDASLYLGTLDADREISHALTPGRHAWIQVLRGAIQLDGRSLAEGDGAAVSDEESLSIRADGPTEVLVFDLA